MTDDAVAAPAAADTPAQPQVTDSAPAADTPTPAQRSKEPARASIDRAFAQVDKQEETVTAAAPKPKETEQPPATGERERDEHGRFKAKDATEMTAGEQEAAEKAARPAEQPTAAQTKTPISDPPGRFSFDAKAAWANTPDPVKSEIVRNFREMEGGIRELQATLEPLKAHMALAKQHNTTVPAALDGYLSVERALRSTDMQHKLTALEGIFETAGISPRDYAAHIMGQKPEQVQSQNDQTIRQLRQELADLKNQIGGVTQSIQERTTKDIESQVNDFASKNPRMNEPEFGQTVAELLQTGYAKNLQDAYDKAMLLKPAPVAVNPNPTPEAAHTRTDAPAQPRKPLAVSGAPTSGSNPVTRKPASTARESLDRAFADLRIG